MYREFGVPSSSGLVPSLPQSFQNSASNRFIYVNNCFNPPVPISPTKPKVLVNPHFKKKVYVNPAFNPLRPKTIYINPAKSDFKPPKIHVNPNLLKNLNVPMPPPPPKAVENRNATTVISTRNKLIRVPLQSPNNKNLTRKRRNSLHTKYKIIRTNLAKASPTKISPVKMVNKFKFDKTPNRFTVDKRTSNTVQKTSRSIRKKYVYVNRFLSMDVVAKTVLFKNTSSNKRGFVNINGIMYKKSPNSLKKAIESTPTKKDCRQTPKTGRRSLVKRFKIVR